MIRFWDHNWLEMGVIVGFRLLGQPITSYVRYIPPFDFTPDGDMHYLMHCSALHYHLFKINTF